MRTRIIVLVLVATIASRVAAQQVDKEKLRKLARFPSMSFEFRLNFVAHSEFAAAEQKPKTEEIAALQKEMKGDASDAERYQRLGELYLRLEDSVRAQESFVKAADLYRRQVESKPNDGRLLTQFGNALWFAGKGEEAETALRQAVKVAPQERQGWESLGQVLQSKATLLLVSRSEGFNFTFGFPSEDYGKLLAQSLKDKPSPEQIAQAQKLIDESSDCYDKAVAAAPQDPLAYMNRGAFRTTRGIVQSMIRALRGERVNPSDVIYPPDAVADLREAARLSPDDWRALTMAVNAEMFSSVLRYQKDPPESGLEEMLSAQSKQFLREATTNLEKLLQTNNSRDAAGAAEVLGILQFALWREPSRAEASFRRAIALDPSRDQTWELLGGLMMEAKRTEELLSLCQQRLKHKDTARNRILLAKVYAETDQLDKAEEQVQAALKLEPNDFTANLALAALLIRRSSDASTLLQAGERLAKAGQVLKESPPHKQWIDSTLTRGIYLALNGDVEAAEKQLKQVLEHDEDNEDAKEALQTIGKGSES
jgi:tetratricopeptide (TPR) repeat protein